MPAQGNTAHATHEVNDSSPGLEEIYREVDRLIPEVERLSKFMKEHKDRLDTLEASEESLSPEDKSAELARLKDTSLRLDKTRIKLIEEVTLWKELAILVAETDGGIERSKRLLASLGY